MKANLEIKARCKDLAAACERARDVSTQYVGVDQQVDTYFQTRAGRLKLRESSLSGGQLVPYLRPDQDGPKRSDYLVIPVEEPSSLKALLSELLGVHCVVSKRREIFLYENVRIHLDEVDGLGSFVEFEAVYDGTPSAEADQRRKLEYLMKELALDQGELFSVSYENLVRSN